MSLVSILTANPRKKTIGGIVIDGYLEETHSRRSTVTKIPVEQGSDISDHIINEPDAVSITGFISSTPMLQTILNGAVEVDRVTSVLEALERLRLSKTLFTVSTGLKPLYRNMAIEDFTPSRNSSTGKGMEFTIQLSQLIVVKNQTVAIPKETIGGNENDQLQAQNEVSQGQTTSGESAIVENNELSILEDVANQLGAL